jgi:hypothetical protein
VTYNIDERVHDDWLVWMQTSYIPEMLETKKFLKAKLCLVMVDEEMGGITYSVQYTADTVESLHAYYKEDADRLQAKMSEEFRERFVNFATELKVVSEHHAKHLPRNGSQT